MNLWVTAAQVRTFANLDATSGRYSDAALGSNIRAAQQFIENRTGRQFDSSTGTRYFTTEGRAAIAVPDVRSVTSVVLNGSTLVANETYYLLADPRFPGVYTTLQFRAFSRYRQPWYLAIPDWWDRGLDMPGGWADTSLPNDLAVTSSEWGWATPPDDVLHAVKVYAAWLTKRADAMLGNAVANPDGTVFAYDRTPPEVEAVVNLYRVGDQMVAIS